MPLEP